MSFNSLQEIATDRTCPHCGQTLSPWEGPPETGWGLILVCNNNGCKYFLGSTGDCSQFGAHPKLGFRYAEDPENNYESFNLLAYCSDVIREAHGGCSCGD